MASVFCTSDAVAAQISWKYKEENGLELSECEDGRHERALGEAIGEAGLLKDGEHDAPPAPSLPCAARVADAWESRGNRVRVA